MSINQTKRDAACSELREIVAALKKRVSRDELQAPELIFACRNILNLWLESDSETMDDAVIGFVCIEGSSEHVLNALAFGSVV